MDNRFTSSELGIIWKSYKATNSLEDRDRLITNYLYLVKCVVKQVSTNFPKHVSFDDLYSPGVIGLIKAVEKYDPTMKNKFETYATFLIRGAILDELRELDWIPRSVYKKSNIVVQAQKELSETLRRDPTDRELANHLKISLDDLETLLSDIAPAILIPLNVAIDPDEENQTSIADKISDDKLRCSSEIADINEFKKLLEEAVVALPEQEKMVLVLYYYENMMLKEIGQIIGLSESRVSQIHSKAIMRLKKRLQAYKMEFINLF